VVPEVGGFFEVTCRHCGNAYADVLPLAYEDVCGRWNEFD